MNYDYQTADPALYHILREHAAYNRSHPTEAEALLWEFLNADGLGVTFKRQHIIGDYIADFVCLTSKLIVELDGGYHQSLEQQEMDNIRTNYLEEKGFHVVRFSNEEVSTNIKGVIQIIKDELIRLEEQSE